MADDLMSAPPAEASPSAQAFIAALGRQLDRPDSTHAAHQFIAAMGRAFEMRGAALPKTDVADDRRRAAMDAAMLAPGDVVAGLTGFARWAVRKSESDAAHAVAFNLRDTPGLSEIGELMLGVIAARRRLWDFADQCFDACGNTLLTRYACADAIEAFARSDCARARRLVMRAAETDADVLDFAEPAEALRIGGFAAMFGDRKSFDRLHARLAPNAPEEAARRWRFLAREFADQEKVACDFGGGYAEVFEAVSWRPGTPAPTRNDDRVTIGLLDYRNPTLPSSNRGDFVQTLGVLGQITRYAFETLEADPSVVDLLSRGTPADERAPVERPVRVIPVQRDFSILHADEGPIWLPVCGWFAHPAYYCRDVLPFARNIIPFFMTFHLARPAMLTARVAAYLKAHEPIGCRDMLTVRTLREAGVSAFFNGCVTLTIRRLFPQTDGERSGRYAGEYKPRNLPDGMEGVAHTDPDIWDRSFADNLLDAASMLEIYRTAESVRTPLLHCLLPCRSMGVATTFTNKHPADPRFEGLVDADEAERARLIGRIEAKFKAVFDAILAGGDKDAVFEVWRAVCAEDVAETDARLARAAPAAAAKIPLNLDAVRARPKHVFGPETPPGVGDPVDLVFCLDKPFLPHLGGTLTSVVENTHRPLRAHLLARDLTRGDVARFARAFPQVAFDFRDLTGFDYGAVRLLAHTSISTMDRLVAPELLQDVGRAVYLDIDVLVRGDIGDLADFPLDGGSIAARDSVHLEWRSGRTLVYDIAKRLDAELAREFRALMFDGGVTSFDAYNAGVLTMDLANLRLERLAERSFHIVSRYGLHDQYALNIHTRDKRAKLPPTWNHFATQERLRDPKLIHFIGTLKPWVEDRAHPYADEWRAYRDLFRARVKAAAS